MRALFTCVGVVFAVGCGAGQAELTAKTVGELTQQVGELRKSQATMSVTVEDLETRLFLVQDELDTYRKRTVMARQHEEQLPVVRVEPQNGPVAEFDPKADLPRVAVHDDRPVEFDHLDDEGNVLRPRAGKPVIEAKAPAPKQIRTPAESRKPLPRSEHDAMTLYQDSYALIEKKHYEEAITGFTQFIEQYPDHGYADNAMYWMGEAYYDRGLWTKALQTFQDVIQSFPLGNKVPDAMLKLGLCHQQLKNFRQAREVLQQVADIYPKSDVARIATTRLEQIP